MEPPSPFTHKKPTFLGLLWSSALLFIFYIPRGSSNSFFSSLLKNHGENGQCPMFYVRSWKWKDMRFYVKLILSGSNPLLSHPQQAQRVMKVKRATRANRNKNPYYLYYTYMHRGYDTIQSTFIPIPHPTTAPPFHYTISISKIWNLKQKSYFPPISTPWLDCGGQVRDCHTILTQKSSLFKIVIPLDFLQ